jgi:hypothetical protein
MTDPITFKDKNGAARRLLSVRVAENDADRPIAREATLSDLRAAAEAQGLALVQLVGEEPTEQDLDGLYDHTFAETHAAEPEEYADDAARVAARRALFNAGRAAGEAAAVAELERRRKVTGAVALERELIATGRRLTEALQRAECAEKELRLMREAAFFEDANPTESSLGDRAGRAAESVKRDARERELEAERDELARRLRQWEERARFNELDDQHEPGRER